MTNFSPETVKKNIQKQIDNREFDLALQNPISIPEGPQVCIRLREKNGVVSEVYIASGFENEYELGIAISYFNQHGSEIFGVDSVKITHTPLTHC